MDEKTELFEKTPPAGAVIKLAVPSILSMLVVVIYNMADTFFIGQTGDPNQVAAVSLAMPVFLLCMAVGNMFGIGGISSISRSLGEGKKERARRIASFCFYGSIVMGIVMAVTFIFAMPTVLHLIGASEHTTHFTEEYLTVIFLGAPAVIVSHAFSNILRSEGAAKEAMIGMMVGSITNIILDPIMILAMNMGVRGAAVATVIGNILGSLYFIAYIIRKSKLLSVAPGDFQAGDGICAGVIAIGLPASLNNILMSLSNIILNNFLASYGDIPVAAMGVAMKANMLVILLQIGLAVGIQPLIGYSYGARDYKRMYSVIRFSCLYTVILGSVLTVLYLFSADWIVTAFIADEQVINHGVPMLRALMIAGPVVGILFVFTNVIQAMGKAVPSLILTLSRQGLVFIPGLIILNRFFGLNGIIYAQPAADIVTVILSFLIFMIVNRGLKKASVGTAPAALE